MSLSNTSGNTDNQYDLSVWGDSTPEGQIAIRDAASSASSSLSESIQETSTRLFLSLTTKDTVNNSVYLRGLQILHALGISTVATSYWAGGESNLAGITEDIDDIVPLADLITNPTNYELLRNQLAAAIRQTTVDPGMVELARVSSAGFGPLSPLAEALLLYFIVLGESNAGGVTV